jgi:hypothetical protein
MQWIISKISVCSDATKEYCKIMMELPNYKMMVKATRQMYVLIQSQEPNYCNRETNSDIANLSFTSIYTIIDKVGLQADFIW